MNAQSKIIWLSRRTTFWLLKKIFHYSFLFQTKEGRRRDRTWSGNKGGEFETAVNWGGSSKLRSLSLLRIAGWRSSRPPRLTHTHAHVTHSTFSLTLFPAAVSIGYHYFSSFNFPFILINLVKRHCFCRLCSAALSPSPILSVWILWPNVARKEGSQQKEEDAITFFLRWGGGAHPNSQPTACPYAADWPA